MAGENNLSTLLRTLSPVLDPTLFVFVTVPRSLVVDPAPLMRFQEAEGDTLILPLDQADKIGLPTVDVYQRITLQVHSDLAAVGLTAAFAACLTEEKISANVVAGYYHDHIFVRPEVSTKALEALTALSAQHTS